MPAIANKATLTSTRMIAIALPSAPEPFSSRDLAADQPKDQLAAPDRALQREGDDEERCRCSRASLCGSSA